MPLCKYCGRPNDLVKAHIVPEAFFRAMRDGGPAPLLVGAVPGEFPRRAPIGVYDSGILCGPCEVKFGPLDTYGAEVFLSKFDQEFVSIQGAASVAYSGASVDKQRTLRFLLSVLWRASVSHHRFFAAVSLGPLEGAAKESLFSTAAVPGLFDAVLSRWSEDPQEGPPPTAILNPHRERWQGVNAWRIYLGRVVAYLKVDQRPFPEPLASLSLQSAAVCTVIERNFWGSKDMSAMRRTAVAAEQNRRLLGARRL